METKKPVLVSGYIRNKKTQETKTPDLVTQLFVAGIVILVLAVYWKFTLAVALIISLVVFAKKYYVFVNDPNRLIVNYFGASVADKIRDNIKNMLREQLHA